MSRAGLSIGWEGGKEERELWSGVFQGFTEDGGGRQVDWSPPSLILQTAPELREGSLFLPWIGSEVELDSSLPSQTANACWVGCGRGGHCNSQNFL